MNVLENLNISQKAIDYARDNLLQDSCNGFNVGERVIFTNDYGHEYFCFYIIGFKEGKLFIAGRTNNIHEDDGCAYWFPHDLKNIRKYRPLYTDEQREEFYNILFERLESIKEDRSKLIAFEYNILLTPMRYHDNLTHEQYYTLLENCLNYQNNH